MASRLTPHEEELTCPVCRDIFEHPVVLSCSHSFCKNCLQEWWTARPKLHCPVCKIRSSSDHPPANVVLRNLCENLLEERLWSASLGSSEDLCAAHGEKLRLFCLNDEQPVCLSCRDSEERAGHKFLPVDEASGRCKRIVEELLKPLKDKLEAFDMVQTSYNQTEKHIRVQAQNAEMQIKAQFKSLRQFLQEEEKARISALRREETLKSREIKERIEKLNRDMVTLEETMRVAGDQQRADDHLFLQNYKATKERIKLTPDCPEPVSGALIDEVKHLGNLAFRVWSNMKEIVSYNPVILDPNTNSPSIVLSDDLTSVTWWEELDLPAELQEDNGKSPVHTGGPTAALRNTDRHGQTPGQPGLQSLEQYEGHCLLQPCHSGPQHCLSKYHSV